jgi:two-component sensor histidine kinase
MKFTDVTHPDDVKLNVWNVDGLTAGEASHFSMEKRYIRKNGETVWVSLNVVAVRNDNGHESYTVGLAEDITARKQAEEQRLTDAREQRDTLVREVHHRIKNNLQSVAGLLQRELGRFLELDPRLDVAISQVNAIATVHGLQSVAPDEAIGLCNGVKSICESVADLSQRTVQFHMEGGQPDVCPVRVATSEAVSMALVINELILNAVKHSPPDSAAPIVSLSIKGNNAQLRIRNALANVPAFNIDTGKGLGTGLRLVRSLLPDHGAQLTYQLDDGNLMLTRLSLTAPLLMNPDSRP